MGSGTSSREQGSNDRFLILDRLTMANGLKAEISQRRSNGLITFSIVREFDRDGITDWTTYIPEHFMDDYVKMIEMVKARIAELRSDPKVAPIAAGVRR